MTNEKTVQLKITLTEVRLLEGLRQHPEMKERMQSILDLARNQHGLLKTADELEERLIAEVRQLGYCTMTQWARTAQERVTTELQTADPTVVSRKKKR